MVKAAYFEATLTWCFSVAGLPVSSFYEVHSGMSTEEFGAIVDRASVAYSPLKILDPQEFLRMRPADWARFLNSDLLRSKLDQAINQPKIIIIVRPGNVAEMVKIFGQAGLDKLIDGGQYLIDLDESVEEARKYVVHFWDLQDGHRYTGDEGIARYEVLRRDVETLSQVDSDRSMTQVGTQDFVMYWLSTF
jgi:hypothetical protein